MGGNHGASDVREARETRVIVQQVGVCTQQAFHGGGIEGVKHEHNDVFPA